MSQKTQLPKIERIYSSRGDNGYDHEGRKCDKFSGVMIKGGIYWLNHTHATFSELAHKLRPLGIEMDCNGRWWQINDEMRYYYSESKGVTKVNIHHDEFFNDTMYIKKAVFFDKENNNLWWYINDLVKHLTNPTQDDPTSFELT